MYYCQHLYSLEYATVVLIAPYENLSYRTQSFDQQTSVVLRHGLILRQDVVQVPECKQTLVSYRFTATLADEFATYLRCSGECGFLGFHSPPPNQLRLRNIFSSHERTWLHSRSIQPSYHHLRASVFPSRDDRGGMSFHRARARCANYQRERHDSSTARRTLHFTLPFKVKTFDYRKFRYCFVIRTSSVRSSPSA